MQVQIFQVDAFTTSRFAGNPAAVMVFEHFPDHGLMQSIAAENNLAETAFLVQTDDRYQLRWFTPMVEVPLCGHATLASAAVVMERLEPGRTEVVFETASGLLPVRRTASGYVLNFPARPSERVEIPAGLAEALGATPSEVHVNQFNYMAVFDDAATIRGLAPDIVAAPGDAGFDFVSRYFAPAKGIPEDPVTGAAHCMLAPYWSARTGGTEFRAFQASRRGGEMICRLLGDRVELEGGCVFYLEGKAEI
jgi:predicted PhzF superfamily epimerase YddE/YHI9